MVGRLRSEWGQGVAGGRDRAEKAEAGDPPLAPDANPGPSARLLRRGGTGRDPGPTCWASADSDANRLQVRSTPRLRPKSRFPGPWAGPGSGGLVRGGHRIGTDGFGLGTANLNGIRTRMSVPVSGLRGGPARPGSRARATAHGRD